MAEERDTCFSFLNIYKDRHLNGKARLGWYYMGSVWDSRTEWYQWAEI